jgi:hypothetical protein
MGGAGAEGKHRAAPAVGCLLERALQRLVDGQRITLGNREVLDREKTAVGMKDIGVLAAASRHVQRTRTGDELVVARVDRDNGLS